MLKFNNIILILIILFLLNYLKYKPVVNKKNIAYNKKNIAVNKKNIAYREKLVAYKEKLIANKEKLVANKETLANKEKIIEKMTFTLPNKDLLYGKDQYIENIYNDKKFNYQNLDILKKKSDNIEFKYDINYFDNRNLTNKLDKENPIKPLSNEEMIIKFQNETKNAMINTLVYDVNYPSGFISPNVKINEQTDQKMLYDYRFLDMNKDKLNNLSYNEDKTIKEIYDDLVFDYKKINEKKQLINKDVKIEGAFGEYSLPVDQLYYDNENNELSFDEAQSLQLAVPIS